MLDKNDLKEQPEISDFVDATNNDFPRGFALIAAWYTSFNNTRCPTSAIVASADEAQPVLLHDAAKSVNELSLIKKRLIRVLVHCCNP